MASIILTGNNLGERHHNFNKIVQESYERKDFATIQDLPEATPIDRIFKIDLAVKLGNTEYIVKNLKDHDMLHVSRALKCKWLITNDIINPEYLENQLYPDMITTAVTKMKHWLFINLKEERKCQTFYEYYSNTNFDYAIKFLKNCSSDFIKEQFSRVMIKLSPHDLKMFCERDREIIKIYFNSLTGDEELKSKYLDREKQYFTVLKNNLTSNTEFVLDMIEKLFNTRSTHMKPFGPKVTKFIMMNQKERFWKKPELYTVYLLNFKTLANCLSSEEIMNLVVILARAQFLTKMEWFSYKKVEPLLNKLPPEEKKKFKRKIFVDKDIGDEVIEWPYDLPSSPQISKSNPTMFHDKIYSPDEYTYHCNDFRSMLKKRKYAKWKEVAESKVKTLLDDLFDEFRFSSFDKTLFELRKRISAESTPINRQNMLLVLVSKTGGDEKNICKLITLLDNHRNEPSQIRAAIVRSLIKRAKVWRLSENTWNSLMEFAQGLGLDGNPSDVNCVEGIHAIFIRELLTKGHCHVDIKNAFLKVFSTLGEYSFSVEERNIISKLFPHIIFTEACEEEDVSKAASWINILLDLLDVYKIPIKSYANLIPKIECLATKDFLAMYKVLMRLFANNIERRALFKVNFKIIQNEQSYLNALRHDVGIISPENLIQILKDTGDSRHDFKKFFNKLSIYFGEKSGLAKIFFNMLKAEEVNFIFVKALTTLAGYELENYLNAIDNSTKKDRSYEASVKANIHLARPMLDINSHWNNLGAKAIANKAFICKDLEVNNYIQKLLEDKIMMKLTLALSKRNNTYEKCLSVVGKSKPTKAIKSALKFLKQKSDLNVWNIIKPLIEKIGDQYYKNASKRFMKSQLTDISNMSTEIRSEISVLMYNVTKNVFHSDAMPFLCHIENVLPNVDEKFVEDVLREYFENTVKDFINTDPDEEFEREFVHHSCLYIRILVKYLLLCKNGETQNRRLNSIGNLFLDKMVEIRSRKELRRMFMKFLSEVFVALRYYKVLLNIEYVSCLPVMEQILSKLEEILSTEKYLKIFVHMLLIIFYNKSLRNHLDIVNLDEFYENKNMVESFTKMVAKDFGNYIILGLKNMKTKYSFDSIEYLYENCVIKIFDQYFENSSHTFLETLINEILNQSKGAFGIYFFKNNYCSLEVDARENILKNLREFDNIRVKMMMFYNIIR